MATEFHLFPFLPWELRDQIWKLAIRPDLPGAHIFRVSDADAHETSDDNDSYRCAKSLLAAPQCLPKSVDFTPAAQAAAPISWTLNNPSTYLIDSGLWTACKESRLATEQVLQARAQREGLWSLKRASEVPGETRPLRSAGNDYVRNLLPWLQTPPSHRLPQQRSGHPAVTRSFGP